VLSAFKRILGGKADGPSAAPVCVFILTYNRPLYLWACLDSLYRNTKYPAKFVLADNASSDPLVREVIRGFERRGMFHAVYYCAENRTDRLKWMLEQHRGELGEFFGFVECDVAVRDSEEGWLAPMVRLMRADPELWMLGSMIDKSDFVDPQFARTVDPALTDEQVDFLVKAASPERQSVDTSRPLVEPHNPPMRLLLVRTRLLEQVVIRSDFEIYNDVKRLGHKAQIASGVVHRHLSLLNLFDYPGYDAAHREEWVEQLRRNDELTEL
jgi:glycosyltransferase involved in cell wall biosynthesis